MKSLGAMYVAAVFASTIVTSPAGARDADSGDPIMEIMALAKASGACGIFRQMIQFQADTEMPGGDEFVARFLATEAARLGHTPKSYLDQCVTTVGGYAKYWEAAESMNKAE